MSVWDKRIEKACKYLERSREHGRNVYNRYKDDRQDAIIGGRRVNIFYANVNTIKESLFNSLPKPDVKRLHMGDYEDDVSRVAALILQRGLTYEVHCAKSFEASIKSAVLDRLVPGIGQVWVRFAQPEQIFIDTLYWEDFIYSPARCWDLVTWVGRRHEYTKEEFIAEYGEEAFTQASQVKNDSNVTPKEISDNKYCVYEIWDKATKKVFHIVKGAEKPVKELDDPYQLPDFFPCPRPLIANTTTAALLPVTDYHLAQDQYNELDILYARMSLITQAVKVAGCYDAATPEIGRMLQGQENVLIPVDNWAMYAEKGGANGTIDWYPVEQVVTVYQALQGQYEFVKATLYEVTGMSDIMRGASNQYETAAAQEIKAQFASVRLGGYQRTVSQFVSDIINIMAQMMCKLYSDEKFMQIVGTFSPPDQAMLPQAGQVLRDDLLRKYKVSIQADSLTQSDWALEKGQRMELTGYISQYLTAAVPAVQTNPELAPLLVSMLKFTVAGYKGSAELEGILDQTMEALMAPKPEGEEEKPSPEALAQQAEQAKMEQEAALEQQRMQQEMAIAQQQADSKLAIERAQMEADAVIAQMEQAHKERIHTMELEMMQMELEFKREEQRMKLETQAISGIMKTKQQENDNAQRERSEDDD
jgi:hypothetical protein